MIRSAISPRFATRTRENGRGRSSLCKDAGDAVTGDVCVKLADGEYTILSAGDRHSLQVNYA